jgi:putative transposase
LDVGKEKTKSSLWQALHHQFQAIRNSRRRIKKKLEEVFEEIGSEDFIIGLLDESSVSDCSGKSRVLNTEKVTTPINYKSKRLYSLFGFLCLNGKSVSKSTQKCKKEDFLEFLLEVRLANGQKTLVIVLDNASTHRAKVIKEYCANNRIILVYLPPYSPNLNLIEYCWKDVKKRLSQFYKMSGQELESKGQEITQELLHSRCNSYTKKWQECFCNLLND